MRLQGPHRTEFRRDLGRQLRSQLAVPQFAQEDGGWRGFDARLGVPSNKSEERAAQVDNPNVIDLLRA